MPMLQSQGASTATSPRTRMEHRQEPGRSSDGRRLRDVHVGAPGGTCDVLRAVVRPL